MSRNDPHGKTLYDLPRLASPARRALQSAGIQNLVQLTEITEAEVLQLHGMGQNALATLRAALAERGLAFRGTRRRQETMEKMIRGWLDGIRSKDRQVQHRTFLRLMEKTEKPVDWAYAAWDELIEGLAHRDNHVRAISAQLLANLAKSDPKGRMFKDFGKLLDVTKDERFVTARHCLQSIWKVGLAGKNAQHMVVKGLEQRYLECVNEKNRALIRHDIIQDLCCLYHATTSSEIKEKAMELIGLEQDPKYKRKYAALWRT